MSNGRSPSKYWSTNQNPYLDNDSWAGGLETNANIELEEFETLANLRKIASNLSKNNFTASGVQSFIVNSVIGGKMIVKITYPDEAIEKRINDKLDIIFNGVDINDEITLEEWLEMIVSGAFEKGDILINLMSYDRKATGTRVVPELIEASRIETPEDMWGNKNISNGVETDENGRLKGYWVRKRDYIDEFKSLDKDSYIFINAFKMIGDQEVRASYLLQCPHHRRPMQSRGIPGITPIMGLLRFFAQYFEAILVSARVAACFCGVMNTENPYGSDKNLGTKSDTGVSNFKYTRIVPGMIMQGDKNASITFSSPNRPSDNTDAFIKRQCMFVGMGMRIPYIHLYLDMADANYSNYKGANNEVSRMNSRWHIKLNWVIRFVVSNILKDMLIHDNIRFSMKKIRYDIVFPPLQNADAEKAGRADKTELEIQTTSVQKVCERDQKDYDKVMRQQQEHDLRNVDIEASILKKKQEYEKSLGIIFPTEGSAPTDDKDSSTEDKKTQRKQDGNW